MIWGLFLLFALCFSQDIEWEDVSRFTFIACDSNQDQALNREEFGSCILKYLSLDKNADSSSFFLHASDQDIDTLLTIVDQNHDNEVDFAEYTKMFTKAQHPTKAKEKVKVKTKDGKSKYIAHDDLFAQIREQTKGFKSVNGKLYREEEQTEKVTTLQKDHPILSKFLALGEWTQSALQTHGFGEGRLVRLRSLSDKEEGLFSLLDQSSPYLLEIEIVIQNPTKRNSTYYAKIEHNPRKFSIEPHYYLWEIREGGKEGKALWTSPPLSPSMPSLSSLGFFYENMLDFYIKLSMKILGISAIDKTMSKERVMWRRKGVEVLSLSLLLTTLLLISFVISLAITHVYSSFSKSEEEQEREKEE